LRHWRNYWELEEEEEEDDCRTAPLLGVEAEAWRYMEETRA
jgi:hypothetical protein